MHTFHYRAFNSVGETVQGAVEADSLSTLETRLRGLGMWLLDAREGGVSEAAIQRTSRMKVRNRDVIAFFVQMSLLLRSGITLPNALERLADDFSGTRMGTVVAGVAEQVTLGLALHKAMALYPRVFSSQVVAIVHAGEVSGRVPDVFENLRAYFEWLDDLLAEIRQALIYPLIVLTAATALIVLLFTLVVPQFVKLLEGLALEVPLLTRGVMAVSDVLVTGWPVIVAVMVGGPIALKLARRIPKFAIGFDRALMRLPVFGSLVAMFALSRFAHNMAMLYESGISLLKGLGICRGLVGNRAIEHALEEVEKGVLEGTPMSKGLAQHEVFPATLVTMIATGETSGNLDEALHNVSSYYNNLIPRRIKVVFAIFNPAMMLSLIGIVGVVALSVVLPILQLWQVR